MALPPISHRERRSKTSAPGHIAIGTCTRIGCSGWPSHFPFKKSNSHFMVRNRSLIFNTRLLTEPDLIADDVQAWASQPSGFRLTGSGGFQAAELYGRDALCGVPLIVGRGRSRPSNLVGGLKTAAPCLK